MIYKRKDFLGLRDTSAEEITYILNTAETMKYILNQKNKKSPHLQGKSVITLFYEQSSRARLFYEMAAAHLSAGVADMLVSSGAAANESLQDIGILIDQLGANFIIIKHPMAGAAHFLAKNVKAAVINAGDGLNENPGQGLLDLLAIKEQKGNFENLKVALIGDLAHSRAGKSDIWGLTKLGAQVSIGAPPNLIPAGAERLGVNIFYEAKKAVEDADVIMSLRFMSQRHDNLLPSVKEYRRLFKIDEKLLRYAKKDAIVMHPGPINRDVEIAASVVDSSQCIINDQISNGVAVRMAVLYLLSQIGGVFNV